MQLFALSSVFKDCTPPTGGQDPTVSVSKPWASLGDTGQFALAYVINASSLLAVVDCIPIEPSGQRMVETHARRDRNELNGRCRESQGGGSSVDGAAQ